MSSNENEAEVKQEAAASQPKQKRGFFCRNKDKKEKTKPDKERKRMKFPFFFSSTRPVWNKKVKGKVMIDQTTNNDLWQKIVDNSLVGTGVVSKAAICAIESGGIIAYNPKDFTPAVDQIKYLAASTEEPDRVSATGIKVADLLFIYRSGIENKALFGEGIPEGDPSDRSGVVVYMGRTKVLIAVYDSGKGDQAKKTCGELFEYFVDEQEGF